MGARASKEATGVLSSPALRALVADVRVLMEQGRARAEAAVGRELVRTYHAVGSRIVAERLTGRAGYGSAIVAELASEIGVSVRARVRLAGVDAPGPREPGGAEATAYVREALARVEFVMLHTVKVDLHGRYVGHVFFAPGVEDKAKVFAKGRYLNQELVAKGLARVV